MWIRTEHGFVNLDNVAAIWHEDETIEISDDHMGSNACALQTYKTGEEARAAMNRIHEWIDGARFRKNFRAQYGYGAGEVLDLREETEDE